MCAVKGSLATPLGDAKRISRPSLRLMVRLVESVGSQVRKLPAVEDHSAPILTDASMFGSAKQ